MFALPISQPKKESSHREGRPYAAHPDRLTVRYANLRRLRLKTHPTKPIPNKQRLDGSGTAESMEISYPTVTPGPMEMVVDVFVRKESEVNLCNVRPLVGASRFVVIDPFVTPLASGVMVAPVRPTGGK